MPTNPGRLALLLIPLLLAACGASSGMHRSTEVLQDRLATRLRPEVAGGQVALTRTSDGAQVTLVDPTLVPPNGQPLDTRSRFVLASVIQGLLDPSLLQIAVLDPAPLPVDPDGGRVRSVTGFLQDFDLGPSLRPAVAMQPVATGPGGAPAPTGLTIAISLHCPNPAPALGWGYEQSYPTCR